jgi:DNA-directed RNA polymerase subunit beta'
MDENPEVAAIVMAKSGSRGNVSQFAQLLGMRGLMNKATNYDFKKIQGDIENYLHSFKQEQVVQALTENV